MYYKKALKIVKGNLKDVLRYYNPVHIFGYLQWVIPLKEKIQTEGEKLEDMEFSRLLNK